MFYFQVNLGSLGDKCAIYKRLGYWGEWSYSWHYRNRDLNRVCVLEKYMYYSQGHITHNICRLYMDKYQKEGLSWF